MRAWVTVPPSPCKNRVFWQVDLSDWGWYRKSVPPPSGPLLSEHQRRDRVVPAAVRAGLRRASRRWRRPTPRAPRFTRSLKALPQWWNVARPTRLSFSKLPVVVRRISSSPEGQLCPPSPDSTCCVSDKIGRPKTFCVSAEFQQKLSVLVTRAGKRACLNPGADAMNVWEYNFALLFAISLH